MKWCVLAAMVAVTASASLSWTVSARAQASCSCAKDTDCPGSTCGGQVCLWPDMTCVPATPAEGGAAPAGWCVADTDCKCQAAGATCSPPSSGAMSHCSFIVPQEGGTSDAGSVDSGGAIDGSHADSSCGNGSSSSSGGGSSSSSSGGSTDAGRDATSDGGRGGSSSSSGGNASSSGSSSGSGSGSSSGNGDGGPNDGGGGGSGSTSGCSCRVASDATSGEALGVLAVGGWVALARRRRRR